MSEPTLVFVDRATEAPPPAPGTDVVVLDTAWTPGTGERADLVPVRPAVATILEQENLIDGSLARLDAWAAAAGLADALTVEGVSWWFRIRMALRWDVHELLLWRHVLDLLAPPGRYHRMVIPAERRALLATARASGPRQRSEIVTFGAPMPLARLAVRVGRGLRRRTGGARDAVSAALGVGPQVAERAALLDARADRLAAAHPVVVALAWAGAFQIVDEDDGRRRNVDPHLSLVLDRLRAEGSPVATVATGLDHRREADWASIAADDDLIPGSMVRRRWELTGDEAIAPSALAARIAHARRVPMVLAGSDLGPAIHALVADYADGWLDVQRRRMGRAERLLGELRPGILFVDREGTRTPWIAAARRLAIPVVAVQHGMIYPNNPEYCYPPHAAAVRPDTTCVFGQFERDLLLDVAGYRPEEVVVTGSPRADPERAAVPSSEDERADVRRRLRVADDARLLTISVAHNAVLGDLHSMSIVARLLDGSLPGVHVVIKLHPQDRAAGRYETLVAGLAGAGGYDPAPLTVVRDFDVYRLLRASDAHLGLYSTVLTDAVAAGTPNMIAVGQAYADPLGYVAAGVAVAVRSIDDVRAFAADPRPPRPEDRARFLAAHFRPGDSIGRIAEVLRAVAAGRMAPMSP